MQSLLSSSSTCPNWKSILKFFINSQLTKLEVKPLFTKLQLEHYTKIVISLFLKLFWSTVRQHLVVLVQKPTINPKNLLGVFSWIQVINDKNVVISTNSGNKLQLYVSTSDHCFSCTMVSKKQVIYTVPKSQKRIRVHWGWVLGGRVGWLKVVGL